MNTFVTWSQEVSPIETQLEAYYSEYRLYKNQNMLDLAFEALDKARTLADSTLNEKGWINSFHYFALLFLKQGDKEKAAKCHAALATLDRH